MICPNCKVNNADDLQYCFYCGTKLSSVDFNYKPPILKRASIKDSYKRKNKYPTLNIERFRIKIKDRDIKILKLILLSILSYLPSIGFYIQKNRKRAVYALLAFIILIDAFLLLIKSKFLTLILFLIAALSVYCASSFALNYINKNKIINFNLRNIIIINFIITAGFIFLTSFFIWLLPYRIATVSLNLYEPFLKKNDILLISNRYAASSSLKKGDAVIFVINYETLGIIMATSGDILSYEKNILKINNNSIMQARPSYNLLIYTNQRYEIKNNEYLVLYAYIGNYNFNEVDIVNNSKITGKAIAIINPANRRKLL